MRSSSLSSVTSVQHCFNQSASEGNAPGLSSVLRFRVVCNGSHSKELETREHGQSVLKKAGPLAGVTCISRYAMQMRRDAKCRAYQASRNATVSVSYVAGLQASSFWLAVHATAVHATVRSCNQHGLSRGRVYCNVEALRNP